MTQELLTEQEKYEARIKDLHSQLEDKARELGGVAEEYDKKRGEIINIRKEAFSLETKLDRLTDKYNTTSRLYDEKKDEIKHLGAFKRSQTVRFINHLKKLEARVDSLKDEIARLVDEKKTLVVIKKEVSKEEKKLSELEDKLNEKREELRLLKKEYGDVYDYVTENEMNLERGKKSLDERIKRYEDDLKTFGFYARRLERLYRKMGVELPDDVLEVINVLK